MRVKVNILYKSVKDLDTFVFEYTIPIICHNWSHQAQVAYRYVKLVYQQVLDIRSNLFKPNLKFRPHSFVDNVRAVNTLRWTPLLPLLLSIFERGNNLKRQKKQHLITHGAYLSLGINYNPEETKGFQTPLSVYSHPKKYP